MRLPDGQRPSPKYQQFLDLLLIEPKTPKIPGASLNSSKLCLK
jgi:hypothetical protein